MLGIGIGVVSYVTPIYIAEVAPKERRASLITLNSCMIVLGQVTSCLINVAVKSLPNTYNWRISMGLAAVPALLMEGGLLMLPESPRWLIMQGREAEARVGLARARGVRAVTEEFDRIKEAIETEVQTETELSISDVASNRALRTAFLLTIMVNAGAQFSGIKWVHM